MRKQTIVEQLLVSQYRWRPVALSLLLGYPLVFLSIYAWMGMGAIMLGLLPIVIAAWGWTRQTALFSAILVFVAHVTMITVSGGLQLSYFVGPSYIAGHLLMGIMAFVLGTLFDQYRIIHKDLLVAIRLNSDLEAYTRTVAHDLKNPLAGFVSSTTHLKEEWGEILDETSVDLLSSLEIQSKHMLNIVDGLLKLALIENEAIELSFFNPEKSIRSAWVGLSELRGLRKPSIAWPSEWLSIYGYEQWFQQVADNLLSNAIKYGGDPPQIKVGFERKNSQMTEFFIEDNGEGMSAFDRQELLKEFSKRPRAKIDSNGIGLTIVQRILKKVDTDLEIQSAKHFPSGTRFSFLVQTQEFREETT